MAKDVNGTELRIGDKVRRALFGTLDYPVGYEDVIQNMSITGTDIYLDSKGRGSSSKYWIKVEEQKYPNPPHPHAEVIKAWADGAEVEWRMNKEEDWKTIPSPMFNKYYQYRVKPQESEALRAAKEQLHQAEKAVQAASEAVQRLQEDS